MRKLFKFSLHKRKLNEETIWDFQDLKNSKIIVSAETIRGNTAYHSEYLLLQIFLIMNICHSEYLLFTSQYPKDKKIGHQRQQYLRVYLNDTIWPGPNVSTTPIMAMGCRQCLPHSVVQLKGKHCRKPHCHNGVVDTFGPVALFQIRFLIYRVFMI